ncbi:alpha/beta fold hydrolase [Microbacterium oxydans]|nr:alpha/beta fold hydrolase [Microbacterium oxydans]
MTSAGRGISWQPSCAGVVTRCSPLTCPPTTTPLTLEDYAEAVVDIVGARREVTVVGHSFGAFTAPLVAAQLAADELVLFAGMIPTPDESPSQWWENSGYTVASASRSAQDGGLTGNADPLVSFYNGVPARLQRRHCGASARTRRRRRWSGRGRFGSGPTCRREWWCSRTTASSPPGSCATWLRPASG